MKSKIIVSAIMALTLSTSGIAFAQNYGNQQDHRGNQQDNRGKPQDNRGHNDQMQRPGDGRDNRVASRNDDRGAGPQHQFRRGGRLPAQYRNKQYVVNDWRGHRLSAPPRGYNWVQTGSDYVLAAIGTGVILQLFLNN